MATGLDRLERLLSKKRRKAAAQDLAVPATRPVTPMPFSAEPDATTHTFPQPSFIRPTSSRMVAREEVAWAPKLARRARSLPETPNTPRLMNLTSPTYRGEPAAISAAPDQYRPIPQRLASLTRDVPERSSSLRRGASPVAPLPKVLKNFSYSFSTSNSEDNSSAARRSRPASKSLSRSASVSVSPKAQVNRRRLSAGALGQSSPLSQGTETQKQSSQRDEPICEGGRASLPRSTSLSTIATAKQCSNTNSTLKEPTLNDFLALSDDDIADGRSTPRTQPPASNPPTFALPPDPPAPASSPAAQPLLTLSPPLARRPAAAAAFEAARIAVKHRFDLVYVVNLWPSYMSHSNCQPSITKIGGAPVETSLTRATTPSLPASPDSHTSGEDSCLESRRQPPHDIPRSGMTGRLLAAYGLPQIMYPFRISAPVHQKVLRAQGWLEYRSESCGPDEFARGYSCSFYTGHSPARGSEAGPNTATTSSVDGKQQRRRQAKVPNRGIVFAAFRLPQADGTVVDCSGEELQALHKDAEALVDMLIDSHMAQRQRRAAAPRRCVAGQKGSLGQRNAPLVSV